MTTPLSPTTPSVGRSTGFVLTLVVVVCVVMIGFAGFLKYELDRAEATLAAPESALAPDQEAFQKLRRNLGFSGFTGMAQNFAATHDPKLIPEMKAQLKQANDVIARLPERTSAESRHDLQAILATFDAALQKADKAANELAASFTNNDLTPLYGALPILDSRLESAAASNRVDAQNRLQFWAMLLTLVSWSSLIIAAAMSVGIYLALRERNSAPLRALAQSIKNMARGDMRTPIWGMERQDIIGDLARAADMARYHFSQLPDMSLLSDQGPVRMRFEGGTKSLFEAMMQLITRDSEQVRSQAVGLADAVSQQKEAISLIAARVEAVLQNIEQRGMTGDQHLQAALQTLSGSAISLQHAQEHASDQLNRIVPFMQERAHGIAEIATITGKQVAQTLQALTLTERHLKNSAEQSQEAIAKFAATADDLGGRLFGAVNLLQASGKVLAETTEKTQSRMYEAIRKMGGNPASFDMSEASAHADETVLAPRIEAAVAALETAQKRLESYLNSDESAINQHIGLLSSHSESFLSNTTLIAHTLSEAAEKLRAEQTKLGQIIAQAAASKPDASSDKPNPQMTEFGAQIARMSEKLVALAQAVEATAKSPPAPALPVDLKEQLRDQWYQMAGQIEATRTELSKTITDQIARLEARLAATTSAPAATTTLAQDTQQQMEQQSQILTELVATLGVLDEHMQQLKTDMRAAKG